MPIAINFKICDNAEECNGIEVCPVEAILWDEKKKTIVVDNDKCISCGLCEQACMVNAIKVARNNDELKSIQKEIDDDPRKVADLYLDRYGAMPILPAFLIEEDKFELEVLGSAKLTAVEVFKEEGIICLLKSIPIKEIFKDLDIKFIKMELQNDEILNKYKVRKTPALLFFKGGEFVGKVEGHYGNERKEDLRDKVLKIYTQKS